MSDEIHIAPGIALPLDAATRAIAILAVRGAGKTYTAAVFVEELSTLGVPVVIVDPIGVWWGLRSSASGKGPGIPIVIFGGDHADVPLGETSAETIADVIVDERLSAVLDLSELSKSAGKRFMRAFAERFYSRNRKSIHLVIDEADAFAPQKTAPGDQPLLGAIEDLVRRGRARGIGVTLVTQRSAVLSKDVLTQCEILIAMRTTHPKDRDAIDAWIELHGTEAERDEVLRTLPTFQQGEAWIWSPSYELLVRAKIRKRKTFDSSATPKPGENRIEPKARAEVDLTAIQAKVAATIERAKLDDPRLLRARVAELEQKLASAPKPGPSPDLALRMTLTRSVDQAAGSLRHLEGDLERLLSSLDEIADGIRDTAEAVRGVREKLHGAPPAQAPVPPPETRPPRAYPPLKAAKLPVNGASSLKLRKGARVMLAALRTLHPRPLTRAQVALLAGLTPSGGTFAAYLGDLKRTGLVDIEKDQLQLTAEGERASAGMAVRPTSADELQELWAGRLRKGAREMLAYLVAHYPHPVSREALAASATLEPTAGTFAAYLGDLVRAGLAERLNRGGEIVATDALFL